MDRGWICQLGRYDDFTACKGAHSDHLETAAMGVKAGESTCFPGSGLPISIAHEGLLTYQGKRGEWKERWFVLDASSVALVKCDPRTHQPARPASSSLGRSLLIAEARSLVESSIKPPTPPSDHASVQGFHIVAKNGKTAIFWTKTSEEEGSWLTAIQKLHGGLALGVSERLGRRELLAGKYSLVRELGRGASGIVSLYTWQGKPFAIKKFMPKKAARTLNRRAVPSASSRRPSVKPDDSHSVVPEDVRREIALLKKASSLPFVVQLYDVILDCEHNEYYLVMEFMGGGAIADWDGERKCYVSSRKSKGMNLLQESTARTYMTNLVIGIQALHENRLCHRDIKPENLIADEAHSCCKIGDLGVAHYFREVDGELVDDEDVGSIELNSVDIDADHHSTNNPSDAAKHPTALLKTTKGTYQFLPPEALSGGAFCGFKADIWSIGVTMYALLFGYLPFYSNDVVELFDKIEKDSVTFPSSCQDEEAKDLILSILEKDPEKRITLEAILQHPWMNRSGSANAVNDTARTLQRTQALRIDDSDLSSAVSVLENRFAQVSDAVRHHRLGDLQETTPADDGGHAAPNAMYQPNPIDLTSAKIPSFIAPHIDTMAAQLHFEWCQSKYLQGWTFGATRNDSEHVHPCLMPIRDLSVDARLRNVRAVEETIKGIVALGCHVKSASFKQSVRKEAPLPIDHVELSWELMMLVDLLAENAHEVWAIEYAECGWVHGAAFDDQAKTHPSMQPYMALEEAEKELIRAGVASVMKSCIYLGFQISCSSRRSSRSDSTVASRRTIEC